MHSNSTDLLAVGILLNEFLQTVHFPLGFSPSSTKRPYVSLQKIESNGCSFSLSSALLSSNILNASRHSSAKPWAHSKAICIRPANGRLRMYPRKERSD